VRRLLVSVPAIVLALAWGLALPAAASLPGSLDAPETRPLIAAGEPVVECGWPTTVLVGSGTQCSGALIHPRVVVYAAHCGGGNKTIRLTEDANFAGGRELATESCRAYPNYAGPDDQGHDWAYCLLAEPVEELPLAPPLFGCETELLEVGSEVALVGFGQTAEEPSGVKRWAATSLVALTPGNNTSLVGNPNLAGTPSICAGDSGGPALVRLADGSWRSFGIASTVVGECGGYGAHSLLAGAVGWIEADSGVDITPCHAADGSWAPGPDCADLYAQEPALGSGTWADWCSGTPASGPGRSCGPAWNEFDPTLLPSVEIVSPSWGDVFLEGIVVDVAVAAQKHPEGYAVARVRLEVDGLEVATDDNDPFVFEATSFPGAGVYTLVAVAEDWSGNAVASAPVKIGFGAVEVPDPDAGTETGGSESAGESEGGEDGEGSEGCACASAGGTGSLAWLGFFALWLGLRIRRRSIAE
jgi:uncharacterized protein (TIGR03382 family)